MLFIFSLVKENHIAANEETTEKEPFENHDVKGSKESINSCKQVTAKAIIANILGRHQQVKVYNPVFEPDTLCNINAESAETT